MSARDFFFFFFFFRALASGLLRRATSGVAVWNGGLTQ